MSNLFNRESIERQTTDINALKEQLSKKQNEIEELRTEIVGLQREFTDRLYDYVSDLQNTLSQLETNTITRYSARNLIQTLRIHIRKIAVRGQQLESKIEVINDYEPTKV